MLRLSIEVWFRAFHDQEFETAFRAVQKYIMFNKFPPTIAEIREEIINITNPQALKTGEQAWEEVVLAIKKFGYYQQSEAFNMLDEPTKRAVKAIGWGKICQSENVSFLRNNFIKMFGSFSQSEKEKFFTACSFIRTDPRANRKTKIRR